LKSINSALNRRAALHRIEMEFDHGTMLNKNASSKINPNADLVENSSPVRFDWTERVKNADLPKVQKKPIVNKFVGNRT